MARDGDTVEIRSYRVCFQLERRLHKIDHWRIPLPYGLPVRGLMYGAFALLAVLVAQKLPLLGALLGTLHPALRYIVLPVGSAYVLLRWKVDGRPAHVTALSWLRMRLEPRRLTAFRSTPTQGRLTLAAVTLAPDERAARLRRGVVHGPARVVFRYPASMRARGRTLRVQGEGGAPLWSGKEVRLRPGQRLVVR